MIFTAEARRIFAAGERTGSTQVKEFFKMRRVNLGSHIKVICDNEQVAEGLAHPMDYDKL